MKKLIASIVFLIVVVFSLANIDDGYLRNAAADESAKSGRHATTLVKHWKHLKPSFAATDAKTRITNVQAPEQQIPAFPSAAAQDGILQKAMWSWHDSDITTMDARQRLFDFAAANQVTIIYVHAEGLLTNAPQSLASFIALAAERNIAVELLFGDPHWALRQNHQQAIQLLGRANMFINGLTGPKPVGIHFDVEPHALPGWENNMVSYGNQLIELYVKLRQIRLPTTYLNADLALGYRYVTITRNGVNKTLAQWLIDSTDRTTVMAYRDYALGEDSITDHASHPVNYAAGVGKRTYVGIETTCGLEPEKVSFCEEGKAELNAGLQAVASYFSGNPGYGGNAIHDYTAYARLQ